jgi:hypothetical protein
MFELVSFTTDTKAYHVAGKVDRQAETLGYHFVNTGGCIVFINDLPLYPSGVFDTMYSGYKDKNMYTIRFDNSVTPIPNPELTVITFNQSK